MGDWKEEAIRLSKAGGWSWRGIAVCLGIPKSTVSDLLRLHHKGYVRPPKKSPQTVDKLIMKQPRVLILDIETAPILAYVYRLWGKQHIPLEFVKSDWHVLSYAAKWWGEDEIFYADQRNAEDVEDDGEMLEGIRDLLNKSDVVCGHNSINFDTKKLNSRFLINGLERPKKYKQIDTYRLAKENFSFTSNSLAYLSRTLFPEDAKDDHSEFPGVKLWTECLKGNEKAWDANEKYNKQDVIATERLLDVFLPWTDNIPNFALYDEGMEDLSHWEHIGYHYTNLGKYDLYRSRLTGRQMRGRVNLLTKEKRKSLLTNTR